jgi:hypothetical protein
MSMRRRPLRLTVATSVLLAVIVTLAIIVTRGPAKFFEATAVQSGASCVVRHCPDSDAAPDGQISRKPQ